MIGTSGARLVGRETEQEALAGVVAAARSGHPAAVLVQGEAGIGKTRLVTDAMERWLQADDVVLIGHAAPLAGGEVPFGVVTTAVQGLIHRQGLDAVRSAAGTSIEPLASLVPELQVGPASAPDRIRIIESFATLLRRISHDEFTWLAVEDLHWADTNSRDALSYLVHLLEMPARLLISISLRTQDGAPSTAMRTFVAELVRSPAVQLMSLGRLSRADVAVQLSNLLQGAPSPGLLDRTVALSEGVPFLTEELVAGRLSEHGPLPESVKELMLVRVGGLSQSARQLVRAGSLAEGHLRHELLMQVCGFDEDTIESAVAETLEANMLEVHSAGDGYQFHHALMREAVSSALLPAERVRWHRRWAEALEVDDQPDEHVAMRIAAAQHWWETGDRERAFDASLVAAREAHRLGAETERAEMLARVLDLWPHVREPAERAASARDDIVEDILRAHISADQVGKALALLDDELRREPTEPDPIQDLYLRATRARFANQLGLQNTEVFDHDRHAARLLSNAEPSRMFVRAVAVLIKGSWDEEYLNSYTDLLGRALRAGDEYGTPLDQLLIRRAEVEYLTKRGEQVEAAAAALALVASVRGRFPVAEVTMVESMGIWQLSAVGRYREASDLGRTALARLSNPHLARWAWAIVVENLSYALLELGEWDEAARILDEALSLGLSGESAVLLELTAGAIHCQRGERDAAERHLNVASSALPASAELTRPVLYEWVQWLAAEILADNGHLEQARERLEPLLGRAELRNDAHSWRILLLAARVEADLALRGTRRRRAETESPGRMSQLSQYAADTPAAGDLGTAWTAQLVAEHARCARTDSAEVWRAAVDGWHVTGQVHDQAWALIRLATCELEAGDKKSAADALSEAIAIGTRLGAAPLVDAAEAVARRGRIDVRRDRDREQPAHQRRHGLTAREVEVLQLVAEGRSNDQIAKELFISPKTASVHVSHILTKLNVASRSEATTAAHRLGLLDEAAKS